MYCQLPELNYNGNMLCYERIVSHDVINKWRS